MRQRMTDLNLIISDQAEELRGAQQARHAAEQAQAVLREEIRVLRDHITQLNEGLTDRNYLRAQLEKMGRPEDRVHRLEIEFSDREAAHRATIQQLEQSIAERDQRIHQFDTTAAAQADEVREAQQTCHAAEQAQAVLKEEIRVLREHITQLNEGLADHDRLRAQLAKLDSTQDRVHQLEVELGDREAAHRATIQRLEQSIAERDQRIHQFDTTAAAQADEVREAQQTCHAAEQAQAVLKEEIRVLREHITQLSEGVADRDRLRAQVAKLDSTQDRVHQLEVELSDREAAHRATIQQFEKSIAERDRRLSKVDTSTAAQAEELRRAHQACHAAEQAQEVLKEEIRVLRDHITQLNEGLADHDRLRAQLEKLESVQDRVHQLEVELSDREAAHRGMLQQLEQSIAERDQRIHQFDTTAAAQADEVREAQQTCHAAEQAQAVLKEEIRVLREHITQLNEGLADHDRLRAQLAKLDSTQDRVHQLEVELSDREAAHRGMLQQLETSIVERDKRIEKLVPVNHLLREKESEIKEWEKKLTRTVREHEGQLTKLQEQCAAQEQRREQHQLAEHQLREEQRLAKHQVHERDEQIARLQRQLQDLEAVRQNLTADVQRIPEKDEQINRLRKRLREMQAELRAEASASVKGSSALKVTPLAKLTPSAHPTPSTISTPTSAVLAQGSQNSTRQDSHAKPDKSGVASKAKAEPVTKTATDPKPTPETKATPNKAVSGTPVSPAAVISRQGRPNGTGQDSHAEQPKSGATPSPKAELINKAVPSAKQSPSAKVVAPTKPAVSAKATPAGAVSSQAVLNGAGKSSPVVPPKSGNGKNAPKDDLQKINGIGPVFAQTLNELGTYTFIQIARWKPEDIKKISKKLDTDPERIKRENWIADAKKQHFRKYGEKL